MSIFVCLFSNVMNDHYCCTWGAEFRTDYAGIAELRSLVPKVNMMALTATLNQSTLKRIMESLCMDEDITSVVYHHQTRATFDTKCTQSQLILTLPLVRL